MEFVLFYLSASVAVVATLMVVIQINTIHGLLYLIVSLLASGFMFYLLGAYFAAVLEVIIYAGAIMVLFVFVIMMLNLGQQTLVQEKSWFYPGIWVGPALLSALLLGELIYAIDQAPLAHTGHIVDSRRVGAALFGPYLLAVEAASMLLLAGLVGAYHLGRPLAAARRHYLGPGVVSGFERPHPNPLPEGEGTGPGSLPEGEGANPRVRPLGEESPSPELKEGDAP
jgi:NADH-quinone oxidoreductase subunit J